MEKYTDRNCGTGSTDKKNVQVEPSHVSLTIGVFFDGTRASKNKRIKYA